ncbi:MAG: hypothetical protein WDN10_02040 [bacterium]
MARNRAMEYDDLRDILTHSQTILLTAAVLGFAMVALPLLCGVGAIDFSPLGSEEHGMTSLGLWSLKLGGPLGSICFITYWFRRGPN